MMMWYFKMIRNFTHKNNCFLWFLLKLGFSKQKILKCKLTKKTIVKDKITNLTNVDGGNEI